MKLITLFLLIIFLCFCSRHKTLEKLPENVVVAYSPDYPDPLLPETSTEILALLTKAFDDSVSPPRQLISNDSLNSKIIYPELARRAGVHGIVVVEFDVNEFGKTENIKFIKGIGFVCDDQVSKLVEQLEFEPAKKYGKPVKSVMRISVNYKLHYLPNLIE